MVTRNDNDMWKIELKGKGKPWPPVQVLKWPAIYIWLLIQCVKLYCVSKSMIRCALFIVHALKYSENHLKI